MTLTDSVFSQITEKQVGNTSDNLSLNLLGANPGYNGDLSLSLPILTVPGRNGFNYELNLNYNSSMSLSQQAGWVGLGWNLNVGEVTRGVNKRVDEQHESMFCLNTLCVAGQVFQLDKISTTGDLSISRISGSSLEYNGLMWGGDGTLEDQWGTEYDDVSIQEEEWDSYFLSLPSGSFELIPEMIPDIDGEPVEIRFRTNPYASYEVDMYTDGQVNLPSENSLINSFKVKNSEGFIYHFDFVNSITLDDASFTDPESIYYKYPTSWKLTKIESPYSDDEVNITYDKYAHSSTSLDSTIEYSLYSGHHSIQLADGVQYGKSVPNSCSAVQCHDFLYSGPIYDVWQAEVYSAHILYDYSYVSTVETATHIAEFITSKRGDNIGDSFRNGLSQKQKRLDEIVLREKQSNKIIKRITFDYDGPQLGGVGSGNIYGSQLTLQGISITNPENPDEKVLNYAFQYDPPGTGFDDGGLGVSAGNYELTRIDYPYGGYTEFNYENDQYNWYFASWGNNNYNTGDFVYSDTPKTGGGTRLTSKVTKDGLGNTTTYYYSYGEGVLHYTTSEAKAQDLFSYSSLTGAGVNIGYRHVLESVYNSNISSLPNLAHKKLYFTSPINSTYKLETGSSDTSVPVNVKEAQPDDDNGESRWAPQKAKHGVLWKEEHYSEWCPTTILQCIAFFEFNNAELIKKVEYGYEFPELYRYPSPNKSNSAFNIPSISWRKLTSLSSSVDDIESTISYSNYSLDTDGYPINGDPKETLFTNSNGETRKLEYKFAYEEYIGMETNHMLSQEYSITTKNSSNVDVQKMWNIWSNGISGAASGKWLFKENRSWKNSAPGTAPSDPYSSSVIKNSEIMKYDVYGNPLEISDTFGSVTKYYYGSNTQPFTQNGLNAIYGMYLTGSQRVQNGADPTPCSVDDLCTSINYDSMGRVNSVSDENGQTNMYDYDSYNRLIFTRNSNGFITGANGYGYSSQRNGGSFNASDPNYTESVTYIDPIYYTDFQNSSGWSSVDSYNTFNTDAYGESTVRMGGNGSYKTMYRNVGEKDLITRIDFYPDNTTGGTPHIYLDSGGNRFAVHYLPSSDQFRIQYKISPATGYTNAFIFPLNATPNRWYTIELQKVGGELTAWVYPKGEGRDSNNMYTKTGFSANWVPQFQLTTNDDYFYAANLSIAKSSQRYVSYLDGLGREIQTQMRSKDKVLAMETQYNELGLPEVFSRPIETTTTEIPGYYAQGLLSGGAAFSPGSAMDIGAPVAEYYQPFHAGTGDNDELYAYSFTEFEVSSLGRVEKSTLPGEDHQTQSSQAITTSYGQNTTETFSTSAQGSTPAKTWAINKLNKTLIKDPDGNQAITYTDGWGQIIASGVDMNGDNILSRTTGGDLVTEFAYDERGNMVRVEDPRGLATTYTYNTLGQLISKKLPDQTHPHTYKYDNKGRLRFHRDPSLDAASDYYYYTKYDDLDRPSEVGIRTSLDDFNDETDINNQGFPGSSYSWYIKYSYDGENPLSGHTPNNAKGRLTRAQFKDPNSSYLGSTLYSYNALGLVEWVIQSPAQPTNSNNRKIEYTYDELGRMTRLYFNPLSSSSDDHYFWYYYDELGRLEKVSSYGSNSEGSALTEAEYTYYADGQVKQLKLGDGAQTIDYDYTIQGWIESINNGAASGTDQFGMMLGYTNNGNISHQQWSQAAFSTGTYNYYYDYDSANRLKKACYGSTNSCTSTGDYDVTYAYDKNGNLDYIGRNGYGSSPDIEYYVSFVNGTNKVNDVLVDGVSSATKNYSYDASGNVTENEVQGITSTTYDWRNLPTSLTATGGSLSYLYDADGNRIKKKFGSSEIWYVRGADGQTVAAYQGSTLLYINILAGGQIIGQIEN